MAENLRKTCECYKNIIIRLYYNIIYGFIERKFVYFEQLKTIIFKQSNIPKNSLYQQHTIPQTPDKNKQ